MKPTLESLKGDILLLWIGIFMLLVAMVGLALIALSRIDDLEARVDAYQLKERVGPSKKGG